MEIQNIFKNRAGTIQLSDLDDNFNTVKVSVNALESQLATQQTSIQTLSTQIANFSAVPIGCIVLWSGTIASIPSSWRLCDGTNGTPDLRDKFVIGARQDSSGRPQTAITGVNTYTGGTKDAQIVYHSHNASSSASTNTTVSSDTDTWSGTLSSEGATLTGSGVVQQTNGTTTAYNGSNTIPKINQSDVSLNHSHTHTHTVNVSTTVTTTLDSVGTDGTNSNLPPYYSLAYIMKVV